MSPAEHLFPATLAASHELLQTLLDVSLTSIMLLEPMYAASGEIVDFVNVQLNQAAQRRLEQPARLPASLLTLYPHAVAEGNFALFRDAFLTNELRQGTFHKQQNGLSHYYPFAAQRSGSLLLVSFDDTASHDHSPVGQAPPASQIRARAVRAEAEQRQLSRMLGHMPAAIATLSGSEHRFSFANELYRTLVGGRDVVGLPVAEALPEVVEQGFIDLLNRVRSTGEPFIGQEIPIQLYDQASAALQQHYLNFVYQPLSNTADEADEILVFAIDVTEQVQARQAAEANARRLRLITDALPVLIGYLDLEERYQFTNEAYRTWFDRDPQTMLGRSVREIIGEAAYAGVQQYIARALAGERVDFESFMPYRDDLKKYIRTSYVPDVQDGELRGFHTLVTDITAETLARQQVEKVNQGLEARVQERTREAEAARAEAERQRGELERVFEQSPMAIAVYRGPSYIIELANPTVARLWGRTREQLLGKGLFEALPEVAGMGYEQLLDGVMATGVPFEAHAMEAKHERNGRLETVFWDFIYVPMYEADGSIYGAMVVANEVTQQVLDRREVEKLNQQLETRVLERTQQLADALTDAENQREQLRQQQGLLNGILGQVPASIATLSGSEHRYTFFNELYQELTANRATLGHSVAETLPELIAQGFVELLDHVYATGEPFVGTDVAVQLYDPRNERPEQRYIDFIYQPLFDGQQRVTDILAFILDVTDRVQSRHQAETLQAAMLAVAQRQALQGEQQQQRLRQLFEQAPIAIFVLRGTEYVVEVVNPVMCDMLGRPAAALLGQPYFEAVPELAEQGYAELLAQVWRTGQPVVLAESPARLARHAPDETGYYTFVYQPVFDASDQLTDVMCVALDVTDQVRARHQVQVLNEELQATIKELSAANTRLTHTNADLDTFVYTASHDLKAPISNIEGLLDALREYLPADAATAEPMVPRLMAMMRESVTRFQQTVAHLTDVSRLQHEQPAEAIGLAALVDDVRLDLGPLIETTQAQLLLDVAACPVVYFSAKNLRSILYNLLSNALKYRSPARPPVVRLHAACTDEQVILTVQDNGLGLTAQQQGRLFTLFRRLHTHVEGSGVGLYMLKRIAENAGGSIRVQSEPNVGSTFTVTLPRALPTN